MPLSPAVISFKYNILEGRLLTSVDMVVAKNAGEGGLFDIYKVHMEEVLVTSISEGSSSEIPTFNVELLPGKIAWQVIKQNVDGGLDSKTSFGWDFRQNRKFAYSFP